MANPDLNQLLHAAKARRAKCEAARDAYLQTYTAALPTAADQKIAQMRTSLEDSEKNLSLEVARIQAIENAIKERDQQAAREAEEANWQSALEVLSEVEAHGRRLEAQLADAGKTLNALFADVASLPRLITVEGTRSASAGHEKISYGVIHSIVRSGLGFAIPNSGDIRPHDMGVVASISDLRRVLQEQHQNEKANA